MSPSDWLVVAAGIAAIAWVNWYFFLARRPGVTAAPAAGGFQQVGIRVHGGYEPAVVHVRAGVPVRLSFDRQETSSCSEEVVFPDLGIRKFLPAFQKTAIELPAPKPGRYEFTCGMSMLRGTLVVDA
jgi:plastocyanin domain-containing protein